MNKPVAPDMLEDPSVEPAARIRWEGEYRETLGDDRTV